MMTLRKTAIVTLSAALLSAAGLPATAADTLRVGWTTSDSAQDPYAIMAHNLKAELEERLPGKFDVQMFPNNQLGDEKQMLEGLQYGTLDVGIITNATIANLDPVFQLNDMPFLFADEAQAHGVLDGEVGQEMLSKLSSKGMIGLGFAEGGFRHMINNTRPVTAPNDVEGVKFRTMQNPVFIGMFSSLGGNPTPMAWSETFTAAQQGTIDGLEIPLAVIAANNYPEVTKYLSLTKHTYSALGIIVSERTFGKLPEEEQAAFKAATSVAIEKQRAQVAEASAALIEQLKAAGMTVNDIEDPAAFRKQVLPVYDEFKGAIGEELFDKALAAVQG